MVELPGVDSGKNTAAAESKTPKLKLQIFKDEYKAACATLSPGQQTQLIFSLIEGKESFKGFKKATYDLVKRSFDAAVKATQSQAEALLRAKDAESQKAQQEEIARQTKAQEQRMGLY
jgi:hypothetical protein